MKRCTEKPCMHPGSREKSFFLNGPSFHVEVQVFRSLKQYFSLHDILSKGVFSSIWRIKTHPLCFHSWYETVKGNYLAELKWQEWQMFFFFFLTSCRLDFYPSGCCFCPDNLFTLTSERIFFLTPCCEYVCAFKSLPWELSHCWFFFFLFR